MVNYEYSFLDKITAERNRELFVKIVSLTFRDELPVEEITGKVVNGSVNIDGTSAVRRTCSLTFVSDDITVNNYHWGLNTKFNLYVGLKNNIDKNYDDIVWLKQGMFLINSFNISISAGQKQISISGKDKMCLLNGDIGGIITSLTHDFGKLQVLQKDDTIIFEDYLIKDIIRDAVHHFGQEPYGKIIINDLEDEGLELLSYVGKNPLYVYTYLETQEPCQISINEDSEVKQIGVGHRNENGQIGDIKKQNSIIKKLGELGKNDDKDLFNGVDLSYKDDVNIFAPNVANPQEKDYFVISKYEYGQAVGYRITSLVYPGDLIANVGEALTSILDKITNMLVQYEYFYDVDGNFVFQKKKNYAYTTWNNIQNYDEWFVENSNSTSRYTYTFDNNNSLITQITTNPNFQNVKNDFSIWGNKKAATNSTFPIHLRFAIDKKPIYYRSFPLRKKNADGNMEYVLDGNNFKHIIYVSEEYGDIVAVKNANGEITSIRQRTPDDTPETADIYPKEGKENQYGHLFTLVNGDEVHRYDWRELIYQMSQDYKAYNVADTKIELPKNIDLTNTIFSKIIEHYPAMYEDVVGYSISEDIEVNHAKVNADYKQFVDKKTNFWEDGKHNITSLTQNQVLNNMTYDYIIQNLGKIKKVYAYYDAASFQSSVRDNNKMYDKNSVFYDYYYPNGLTYYELYYTDMDAFWRELYNPNFLEDAGYVADDYGDYYNRQFISLSQLYNTDTTKDTAIAKLAKSVQDYRNEITPFITEYKNHNEKLLQRFNHIYSVLIKDGTPIENFVYDIYFQICKKGSNTPISIEEIRNSGIVKQVNGEDKVFNTITEEDYDLKLKSKNKLIDENIVNKLYYFDEKVKQFKKLTPTVFPNYLKSKYMEREDIYIRETASPGQILLLEKDSAGILHTFDLKEKKYNNNALFKPQPNGGMEDIINYYGEDYIVEKLSLYKGKTQINKTKKSELYNGRYITYNGVPYYFPIIKDKNGDNVDMIADIGILLDNPNIYICFIKYSYLNIIDKMFMKMYDKNDLKVSGEWYLTILNKEYQKISDIKEETLKSLYEKSLVYYGYDLLNQQYNGSSGKVEIPVYKYSKDIRYDQYNYWTKDMNHPEVLNFWFDFLDTNGKVGFYNVSNVGHRQLATNDKNVESIYYKVIPNILFLDRETIKEELKEEEREELIKNIIERYNGYRVMNVSAEQNEKLFKISAQGQSAYDVLNSKLNKHTYCAEELNISSVPVYHLQPNSIVHIKEKEAGINGEYVISKMSIPLDNSGNMSITVYPVIHEII